MKYNEDIHEFWLNNPSLRHILPKNRTNEFPEGFDVPSMLKDVLGDESVTEIGCGYGRLVGCLDSSQYVGYDLNPACVEEAKIRNEEYDFRVSTVDIEYPSSDWIMMYTMALHIPEENLYDFMELCTRNCKKVLIAEIMGRVRWKQRFGKLKFAFNRDPEEYVELLEQFGFSLEQTRIFDYAAYDEAELTVLTFTK